MLGLGHGWFLRLDAAELRTLRAIKGDPGRRHFTASFRASGQAVLCVEGAWTFLEHLTREMPTGPGLTRGRSLHRGDAIRLDLLGAAAAQATLAALPVDDDAVRAWFLGMDEALYRYRMVPFWVAEEWQKQGVTTVVTDETSRAFARHVAALRAFTGAALAAAEHVLFHVNHYG